MATEKGDGKIDPVLQAQQDTLLRSHAGVAQRIGELAHPARQFAVGIASRIVDNGYFRGSRPPEVALDEIIRRVVVMRDHQQRRSLRMVGRT